MLTNRKPTLQYTLLTTAAALIIACWVALAPAGAPAAPSGQHGAQGAASTAEPAATVAFRFRWSGLCKVRDAALAVPIFPRKREYGE